MLYTYKRVVCPSWLTRLTYHTFCFSKACPGLSQVCMKTKHTVGVHNKYREHTLVIIIHNSCQKLSSGWVSIRITRSYNKTTRSYRLHKETASRREAPTVLSVSAPSLCFRTRWPYFVARGSDLAVKHTPLFDTQLSCNLFAGFRQQKYLLLSRSELRRSVCLFPSFFTS